MKFDVVIRSLVLIYLESNLDYITVYLLTLNKSGNNKKTDYFVAFHAYRIRSIDNKIET